MRKMNNIFILLFVLFCNCTMLAQSKIIKNNITINLIDKKGLKQGDWIFYNQIGELSMSCKFKNDSVISAFIFYKNSDTNFIRFPKINNEEGFILYEKNKKILGKLVDVSNDSTTIELLGYILNSGEIDTLIEYNLEVMQKIKHWANTEIPPIYMFGNESLTELVAHRLSVSDMIINKKIVAMITINYNGKVINVDFPASENNLTIDEERELTFIFSTMKRWQPFFTKNTFKNITIPYILNSTLNIHTDKF